MVSSLRQKTQTFARITKFIRIEQFIQFRFQFEIKRRTKYLRSHFESRTHLNEKRKTTTEILEFSSSMSKTLASTRELTQRNLFAIEIITILINDCGWNLRSFTEQPTTTNLTNFSISCLSKYFHILHNFLTLIPFSTNFNRIVSLFLPKKEEEKKPNKLSKASVSSPFEERRRQRS